WKTLKDEQIHLQRIIHNEPSQSLLQYFKSYTGLKSLDFEGCYYSIRGGQPGPTLEDYLDALSNHSSSLEALSILPTYEGNWCFGTRDISALSRLVNLRYLSVAI
ncbi:hypothetical protein BDQ17DRAFT_1207572, partial [Cyathus striatus]